MLQAYVLCTPPPGTAEEGSVSAASGLVQGCRGRSPRRNKLLVTPFPAGEGGWGDRGQESKLKAGAAGDKQSKPPPGAWFAPFPSAARVQPPGTCLAGSISAASGLMPGCRGRSPRRNKLKISPFPVGEGGRGDGGRKANQRQERQAARKASPPSGTTVAGIASAAQVQPPRRVPRRQGL